MGVGACNIDVWIDRVQEFKSADMVIIDLSVNDQVCMYVCILVYVCRYIYMIYFSLGRNVHTFVYVCIYVCMYVRMQLVMNKCPSIFAHMHLQMYVWFMIVVRISYVNGMIFIVILYCMYVCMYVCRASTCRHYHCSIIPSFL